MALSRLSCAWGQPGRVTGLPRGPLPLPTDILADANHRRGLTARVAWPRLVRGRGLWPRGDSESTSAAACTESYGVLQRAARAHEPSYQGRGGLTEGCDRTVRSRRTRGPKARLGFCLRHALHKLPRTLRGVSAPLRTGCRSQWPALLHRCRQRQRVEALGQLLRHCAKRLDQAVGADPGARGRHWCADNKAGG